MKVGVLGSGEVAKVLGSGFLKHGHDVMIGTRTPTKLSEWVAKNPGVRLGSFSDAAKFPELAVLAVKGAAAVDALRGGWRSESGIKARGRGHESHCRYSSDQQRVEILYQSRRIPDGAPAA